MGILRVPIEFLEEFEANPVDTARNFFSLAKGSQSPLFGNYKKVEACIDYLLKNPFDAESMSFDPDFRAVDTIPRYIHCDFGETHNQTGISMVHVLNFKEVDRIEVSSGKMVKTTISLPVLKFDFLGKISAPKGSRVYLDDIRELIFFELAYKRGFRIKLITFDGFQSSQILGELNRAGFPANRLSIDRTVSKVIVDYNNKETKTRKVSTSGMILAAWYALRDAINDGRLIVPFYQPFLDEAKYAEDEKGKRVVSIISSLSLDLLESMAGSVFNAINNEVHYPTIEETDDDIENDFDEREFYNLAAQEMTDLSEFDMYDDIYDEV